MITAENLLVALPAGLREPLLRSHREIETNFLERRWEPAELNGGKFCEAVFAIVSGYLLGAYAASPSKPTNMLKACQALEGVTADPDRPGDRSFRILIPRMLPVLYEIRNNRGVGHIGGDVDPNFMDATAVQTMASWILAELVRVLHGLSTEEAQNIVNALVERKMPLVWELEGTRRVLDPTLSKSDQTLVLLHGQPAWVSEADLLRWVEHSNSSVYRRDVLSRLHKTRLVEYDRERSRVRISPLGVEKVERKILRGRSAALR